VHGPIVQPTSMHKKEPTQETMHTSRCLTTAVWGSKPSKLSGHTHTLAADQ
jgi:hypothetical protein